VPVLADTASFLMAMSCGTVFIRGGGSFFGVTSRKLELVIALGDDLIAGQHRLDHFHPLARAQPQHDITPLESLPLADEDEKITELAEDSAVRHRQPLVRFANSEQDRRLHIRAQLQLGIIEQDEDFEGAAFALR